MAAAMIEAAAASASAEAPSTALRAVPLPRFSGEDGADEGE